MQILIISFLLIGHALARDIVESYSNGSSSTHKQAEEAQATDQIKSLKTKKEKIEKRSWKESSIKPTKDLRTSP